MDPKFNEKVLGLVKASSLAVKAAGDELQVHRTQRAKAASAKPGVLELLRSTGVVPADMLKRAGAMLDDHADTLSLLASAAQKIAELNGELQKNKIVTAGAASSDAVKTAAAHDPLDGPFVGRVTGSRKPSDLAFDSILRR